MRKSEFQFFMTKNYNDYVYKRPKKKKFGFWFLIIMFCICLFVAFNVADIVSSLIIGKGSIFYNGKYYISSSTYYAVSIGSFKNQDEAESCATSVKKQGGAGYVHLSGNYYVLLAMYSSTIDAQSVISKLKSSGVSASIINVNIPRLNFKFSDKDKNLVKAAESFLDVYEFLYDLSIKYDSGSLSSDSVKMSVKSKIDELKFLQKLEPTSKEGLVIKENAIIIPQRLMQITNAPAENYQLNSEIKYVYMQIVFDYIKLCKSLS